MMRFSYDREAELVPGLCVGDVVDALNDASSNFDTVLHPEKWTEAPTVTDLHKDEERTAFVYVVSFQCSGSKDASFVVKIPKPTLLLDASLTEAQKRALFKKFSVMFNNELAVYRMFRQNDTHNLKVLQFYAGREWTDRQSGFILLQEAVSNVCWKVYTGIDFFTDSEICELLSEVAKLQVLSVHFPKSTRTGVNTDFCPSNVVCGGVEEWVEKLEAMRLPFLTKTRLERLRECLDVQSAKDAERDSLAAKLPLVLTHNALSSPKVLWDADGHIVKLVDWRSAHFGSFVHDLAHVLVLGQSGRDRRQKEQKFLQFFVQQLKHFVAECRLPNAGGLENISLQSVGGSYAVAQRMVLSDLLACCAKFDAHNPAAPGQEERPWLERLRCLVEDLWP